MSSYTIIFIYFQKDVFQKTDFKNINILNEENLSKDVALFKIFSNLGQI